MGELIFGGAYYRREFCISKWIDNNNSLQQLTLTAHGLIFGKAYYQKDNCICDLGAYYWVSLYLGGLIIGSLQWEIKPQETRVIIK